LTASRSNSVQTHQNNFHANTLRYLAQRFSTGEEVSLEEKDLLGYFAELYKNSNQGIKGRGKNRIISMSALAMSGDSSSRSSSNYGGQVGTNFSS
jgi:hypothetical protein